MDRHEERTEHERCMTGTIAAAVINFSYNPPEKRILPSHFMATKVKYREPRQSPKQVENMFRSFVDRQLTIQNAKRKAGYSCDGTLSGAGLN